MSIRKSLVSTSGALGCAVIMTGLVLFESVVPPWAPFFILYGILAVIIPFYTRTAVFGSFRSKLTKFWKATAVIFGIGLIWDQGLCTWLPERLLALAGKSDDPFYSINAALGALAAKAGLRFGVSADSAMMTAAAVILFWAPVGEELFYRAYLQGSLKPALGFRSAAVISAAFFALRHTTHFFFLAPEIPWIASLSWAVSTFGFGLLVSWLYEKTESLWPPVLVHFAVNIFGIMLSL